MWPPGEGRPGLALGRLTSTGLLGTCFETHLFCFRLKIWQQTCLMDFLLGGPGWSRAHLRSECPHLCPADQDGDKQLSLPEFISLPAGTVENQQGQDIDDSWVRDRKKEFEELIDANHDGIVTMAELEVSAGGGGRGGASGVGLRAPRLPVGLQWEGRRHRSGWGRSLGHLVAPRSGLPQGWGSTPPAWSPLALRGDSSGVPVPAPWSGCPLVGVSGCLGLSRLQEAAPQWASGWTLGPWATLEPTISPRSVFTGAE